MSARPSASERLANPDAFLSRSDLAEQSGRPVWAKTSKEEELFFVRMNNSSRALVDSERDEYIAYRWS